MTYFLLAIAMYSVLAAWAPRLWAVTVPQIALFAAVIYFCTRHFSRGTPLRFSPFLIAPAAMVILGTAQLLTHRAAYALRTENAALDWAGYLAFGWLAAQLPSSSLTRNRILVGWACFAGAVATIAILTALTSPFQIFWLVPVRFEQAFGPYVYRNHLAGFIELSLPAAIYLAIREKERRAVFLAIAAVLVSACVVAASRTGLILAGVEVFTMLALAAHKQWLTAKQSIAFSFLLICSVLAGIAVAGFSPVQTRFAEEHPYSVRYEILQSTLDMARAKPLTGWGLGNFRTVYPSFGRIDPGVLVNEAHNDWAQWAAEGGLAAVLVMLVFAFWAARAGVRTGWALGVPVVFCHALVDYPFEEPSLVMLVMLLSALAWNSGGRGEKLRSHRHSARQRTRPIVQELNPV